MEAPEQTVFDFSKVPHVAGVPRYLYRRAVSHLFGWLLSAARGNRVAAFDHEVWVWFFAGILKQRWEDSRIRTFNKAMPAK
jgi:hypothetical protein